MHTQFSNRINLTVVWLDGKKKRINILFQSSESISPVNFVLISTVLIVFQLRPKQNDKILLFVLRNYISNKLFYMVEYQK